MSEIGRKAASPVRDIVVGPNHLKIEDVIAVAQGDGVNLDRDPGHVARIRSGANFLDRLLKEDGVVYGVTTGYGDSCNVQIPPELVRELPLQLSRFHGCGMGSCLSPELTRGVMVSRLNSLAKGYSGVSWELLERIEQLLNLGVTPVIPEEGSVGASGDLTPLSYLAAVLVGERNVVFQDKTCPSLEMHAHLRLKPLELRPKEGLALMNGTAVMTALACDAFMRADYISRLCTRLTGLASFAMDGNSYHFDEQLFRLKPHPGQSEVAAWLRTDLHVGRPPRNSSRLQDRYSIRCAPHVIGVLRDSLPWMRSFIEVELNSTNDNPVIDGTDETVLHGGHFYGGHIAFAMDGLKTCVANLADLMDRQLALLVDEKFNHGLPSNLTGARTDRKSINHGFKAVQIGVSAWTAEALKLTMPASVFSRSTECHNQDKVSMGTIAARDCLRILELVEQVAAAHILATVQATKLRIGLEGASGGEALGPELSSFVENISDVFQFLEEDRALESDLRRMVEMIRSRNWVLYD